MTQLAPVEQAPAELVDKPVPISVGSYALYTLPDGGLMLVYRLKGTEVDGHLPIPGWVVQTAASMAGDQDLGPLSVLLGKVHGE